MDSNKNALIIPKGNEDSIAAFCYSDNKKIEHVGIREGVTAIGEFAFNNCKKLHSVKLPSTLKKIGENAFSKNPILSDIELPEGLQVIGSRAFNQCDGLTEIRIPGAIEFVWKEAFASCKNLKKVVVSEGIKQLSNGMFDDATSLEEIFLPESLEVIGYGAFARCTNLKQIELPDSIEIIDSKTFSGCSNLTSVKLPKALKRIKSLAFAGTGLSEVLIPASVEDIERDAFPITTRLIVSPDNQNLKLENGLLLSADGKVLLCCMSDAESIETPESVTEIGENAFKNCQSLTCITLGNNVATIGNKSFYDCKALQHVKIEGNLSSIGEEAFYGCSKLNEINLQESLVSIGNSAFRECVKLKNITIPASVCEIQRYAFAQTGLSKVIIHSTGCLAGFAFAYCNSLKEIELPFKCIETNAFDDCKAIASVTLLNPEAEVQRQAFSGCDKLTTIRVSALNKDVDADSFLDFNWENDVLIAGEDKGWFAEAGKATKTDNHTNEEDETTSESEHIDMEQVKASRSKNDWKFGDTAYIDLFGQLTALTVCTSGESEDGDELSEKEVKLLMWLTTEYDTNKMKKVVLKYCNDTYESWGGDKIKAGDLLDELQLNSIFLRIGDAEDSEDEPDICLTGDCNCDPEHGIAIGFRNKKLVEIGSEDMAF